MSIKPIDGVFKFDTSEALNGTVNYGVETIEIFNLVSSDDPILREVAPEFDFANCLVDPNKFASSLVETCKKNNGIGLSANQCGFPYRVFVMGSGDDYVAHFNPKITKYSETKVHMIEGCLSFPLLGLRITRPEDIEVEYQDFTGTTRQGKYTGISARCFLHELDHMNGIVYTSVARPLALKSGLDKVNKSLKLIKKMKNTL
jgi:peptide deformylase